jgi:TolA-binding protein|tara:strand:- start:276 stop:920 length:645 start_codon:yes stop_codon:yes gene_type:complete
VKNFFIPFILFSALLSVRADDDEFIELYLKIQELEQEIAVMRNQIEILNTKQDFFKRQNEKSFNDLELKILSYKNIEDLELIDGEFLTENTNPLNSYEEGIVLIKKGDFVNALIALRNFINLPEKNEQTPLAYFWLGELNLNLEDYEQSIQDFNTLIGLYPGHWRTPLAKYKLGVIYLEEGDSERAREQFKLVIDEFPESSAAEASRVALDGLK